MAEDFSHLDASGNPSMVDVSPKQISFREAHARTSVWLGKEIMSHFSGGEIQTKKGPVFQTAIIAGTMAAKKTHDLIPLCHPLQLEKIKVQIEVIDEESLQIDCKVGLSGKTGVEMEALTGASVAALTIYDMCKAFSHDIRILETQLIAKSGGKRDFRRE